MATVWKEDGSGQLNYSEDFLGGGSETRILNDDISLYFGSDLDFFFKFDSSADILEVGKSSFKSEGTVFEVKNGGSTIFRVNGEGSIGIDELDVLPPVPSRNGDLVVADGKLYISSD